MTLLNKILIILLGVTIVSAFGFIIYQQHQMNMMQTQLAVAQKTLSDGITRSESLYVSKADLEAFAAANNVSLTQIQKDISSLNATVSGMNQITVNSGGTNQTGVGSTSTTPNPAPTNPPPTVECNGQAISCPNTDPFGYQKNIQNLQLTEPFSDPTATAKPVSVPIGQVSFDASNKDPWSVDTYPRSYAVSNVLATDENGKETVYNQFSVTTQGQTYKVPVTTAKFEQQYPTPSFSFWNPKLFLGADVGVNVSHLPAVNSEFTPNLSVGILSYGKSKVTPDMTFLDVGVGYGAISKKLQLQVAPVQFNVGQVIPILKNTYVAPIIGIGIDGDVNVGGGLRVSL